MRILHLYPFVPAGRHGGTLRLSAALAASAAVGRPELHFFDSAARTWRVGELDPTAGSPPAAVATPGLKRRVFPSTLWESGRAAVAAVPLDRLALGSARVIVLHTTYLAPLLARLTGHQARSVVDVYDLVWRAHAHDAARAPVVARLARSGYAAAVKQRELSAIRRADTVLVAGYGDYEWLTGRHAEAHWVPTPAPVEPCEPRPAGDPVRVGMLGNFAHQSTRASARSLLTSELAADPGVTIVLAGLHSENFPRPPGVKVLGTVARVESFYAEVDCVVAPVLGGSGMKVKLAEAILAGRPVVTTPLGAEGYPARISRHFTLAGAPALDVAVARHAVARFDRHAARADLEPELCWDAVLSRYLAALR